MNLRNFIFRTFPLTVVLAIAATPACFSQEKAPKQKDGETQSRPSDHRTLPVARELTSADGRKLQVIIIQKGVDEIIAKRASDQKLFTLKIAQLSTEDQGFVAELVDAPVRRYSVLLTKEDPALKTILETEGFAVTSAPADSSKGEIAMNPAIIFLKNLTDEQIKSFDVVWNNRWAGGWLPGGQNSEQADRLSKLVAAGRDMVWLRTWEVSKAEFLRGVVQKGSGRAKSKTYVRLEENVIFYNWVIDDWDEKEDRRIDLEKHPEILKEVAKKTKELLEAKQ